MSLQRDLGIELPLLTVADPAPDYREKRRHPRRQLGVRCWLADGESTLYARVYDVSTGGLSIRAPVPFRPGTELELSIVLSSSTAVRAIGRVVWVSARGGGPRMGAEFVRFQSGHAALDRLFEGATPEELP